MPAKSKQQQKFFGVVRAMQKGDIPKKGEAGEVADDMKQKDVKDMAKTKHKGLPRKVKEIIVQEVVKALKLHEAYIWDQTGDSQDRKFFNELIERMKETYSNIAPKNYNIDNFETDLEKATKKIIEPEMDIYAAANKPFGKQTPEERKYTRKVWVDWLKEVDRVFRTTTTFSGYKGVRNSFISSIGTFFKVMMMAHGGDTSSMGYKVMKKWKDTNKAKHDKKFGIGKYATVNEAPGLAKSKPGTSIMVGRDRYVKMADNDLWVNTMTNKTIKSNAFAKLLQKAYNDEQVVKVNENINDPMLKSLRTITAGEKFPNLKQWWKYQPEDIMTYVYWHQGQLPPSDQKKFEKEYASIVKQLHKMHPIPASALPKLDVDDETERALSVDAPDMNEATNKNVDKIKRDLVNVIDAMKKNIEKFKSAKDADTKKKHAKIAYKLQDEKKKLEKELDKAVLGIHADAELELNEVNLDRAGKPIKGFQPGDMWREDFDYIGMLKYGAQATYDLGLETLQALFDSFEDVNYHRESQDLGNAIDWMEDPGQDANQAQERIEDFLARFRKKCMSTLDVMKIKWTPGK
jgi:hypothetical protein